MRHPRCVLRPEFLAIKTCRLYHQRHKASTSNSQRENVIELKSLRFRKVCIAYDFKFQSDLAAHGTEFEVIFSRADGGLDMVGIHACRYWFLSIDDLSLLVASVLVNPHTLVLRVDVTAEWRKEKHKQTI